MYTVQCCTVWNATVDIHCNISSAVPVLWPQHQLIVVHANLVQMEHDKSHPQYLVTSWVEILLYWQTNGYLAILSISAFSTGQHVDKASYVYK